MRHVDAARLLDEEPLGQPPRQRRPRWWRHRRAASRGACWFDVPSVEGGVLHAEKEILPARNGPHFRFIHDREIGIAVEHLDDVPVARDDRGAGVRIGPDQLPATGRGSARRHARRRNAMRCRRGSWNAAAALAFNPSPVADRIAAAISTPAATPSMADPGAQHDQCDEIDPDRDLHAPSRSRRPPGRIDDAHPDHAQGRHAGYEEKYSPPRVSGAECPRR